MPSETLFLRTAELELGDVRCGAAEPEIAWLGPIARWGLSFPRRPIRLRAPGGEEFVADGSSLLLLTPGARFERSALTGGGAHCHWLGLEEEVVGEWLARHRVGPGLPRQRGVGLLLPKSAGAALAEHALFRGARAGALSAAAADEGAARLVDHALPAVEKPGGRALRRERDLIEAARAELSRADGSLSTHELARRVGISVFRLCRLFRRATGRTVQEYARRLRLEAALERLADRDVDLSALALDLGFASHSHFTATFRSVYGVPPSAYRGRARRAAAPPAIAR